MTTHTARDREWLRDLWHAHADAVQRYVRRRTPWSPAEDLTSETFLVAWRRREDVPRDALPWLLATVRNHIGTALRAGDRQREMLAALRHETRPEAVHDGDAASRLALREAWGTLPEDDREVLTLIAWDGLTNDQAGAVLGISGGTFAVRLHRARARLEKSMQEAPDEVPDSREVHHD